jgi:hypothetical protein
MPRYFGIALVASSLAAAPAWCGAQGTPPPKYEPDATLASTPSNVVWGYIPSGVPPALTIKSGQTVRIDMISHQGLLTDKDPAAYFGAAGIPANQVLDDAKEVYRAVTRPKGAVLTS